MLIDDHAGFRRFLRKCLARHPFIEVVGESASAEEAWVEIERLSPDLLTVDVHLPGQDGFEFVRKAQGLNPEINAIFISFNGSPAFRDRAREMNCPYLVKDNLPEDLAPVLEGLRTCPVPAGAGANFEDDKGKRGN